MNKPFAIVTGASSGIGFELAQICTQEGFDLLVAADRPEIHAAADRCRDLRADPWLKPISRRRTALRGHDARRR